MMYTVRVDQANPRFAKMLLEQFGGPNGELGAALRYFSQGWAESDAKRRDLLLNIATEELSHLEMVGQMLTMLLKGSPGAVVDQVEGGYLGDLVEGKHDLYTEMSLNSSQTVLGGPGPRFTDSAGRSAVMLPTTASQDPALTFARARTCRSGSGRWAAARSRTNASWFAAI